MNAHVFGHIASTLAIIDILLAVLFSIIVVGRRREPAATLAWVLGFFLLPYIGFIIYILFGFRKRRMNKRLKPNPSRRASFLGPPADATLDPELANVENLAHRMTGFPMTDGNRIDIYHEPGATDDALAEALKSAEKHIHMEYYIFEADDTGKAFQKILRRKAREGVQCRLLLDALGSRRLPKLFLDELRADGVDVAFFSPLRFFRRPWRNQMRNHRKISVVDGKIGFLGSQNIARESLKFFRDILWRETDVRLDGPAVEQLQAIFAEDWAFAGGKSLDGADYFPPQPTRGTSTVQTLPTGPDGTENALQLIFLAAVHAARKRVIVATPYFIPTPAMALALEGAARRGVRVDILLPKNSDHPIVTLAGRSWYHELMESGVRIFEHGDEFIHSKVVSVDGRLALVGSANMDTRSFLINFEASLLIYDPKTVTALQSHFDKSLGKARAVSLKSRLAQGFLKNTVEGFCRLLSPIL